MFAFILSLAMAPVFAESPEATPEATPPVTPEATPPVTPEAAPPVVEAPPVTPEAAPPATPVVVEAPPAVSALDVGQYVLGGLILCVGAVLIVWKVLPKKESK
jgi:uncharacterized membrane protein